MLNKLLNTLFWTITLGIIHDVRSFFPQHHRDINAPLLNSNKRTLRIKSIIPTTVKRSNGTTDRIRSRAVTVVAFASCAPPRFDLFSEKLVGKWSEKWHAEKQYKKEEEVEEVMRSCGGAVQGLREVPINDSSQRAYHNRADDGFIYLDCGSYSSGPLSIGSGNGSVAAADGVVLMTSLSFPTVPKRRMLMWLNASSLSFSSNESEEKEVAYDVNDRLASFHPFSSKVLVRGSFGGGLPTGIPNDDSQGLEENGIGDDDNILSTIASRSLQWRREMVCCMPSPGQSWMLQRVKWQNFVSHIGSDDGNSNGVTKIGECDLGKPLQGWAKSIHIADNINKDFGEEINTTWNSPEISKLIGDTETALVVQIGALCTVTHEVRALLRCYDSSGMLKIVAMQEGTTIPDVEPC